MEASLRLAHPLMPYLTEEIWQTLAPMLGQGGPTIMTAQYPIPEQAKINEQAEADMQWLQGLIGAVRNIRGEMGLGNARLLPVLLQNISNAEREQITRIEALFKALAKVESIEFLGKDQEPPLSSSSVVGHASVFVPMKGLIDPKAELGRLQKTWIKSKSNTTKLQINLQMKALYLKHQQRLLKVKKRSLLSLLRS